MDDSGTETNRKKRIQLINLLWYSPVVLAFLFSYYCIGVTSIDSGHYITKAFEFTRGEFDFLFRPGFILLLGSTFKVLEPSIWAAVVLIRFFFVANILVIFFMARYLFNEKIAFAAAMTLLTSYFLNYLSHRVLLDNVHPFFVILAVFLSIVAVDRRSMPLAVGAGVVYIYTYLVKVTTILFLPFPILFAVFWHSFRIKWSNLRQAVVTCGIGGAGIVVYQLLARDGSNITRAQRNLGQHSSRTLDMLFGGSVQENVMNALNGFVGFWDRILFTDVFLGCLFAASWFWLIVRSVKSNSSRTIMAIFILFIPAAIYLGLKYLRLGQAGIFLFISFIPVGVLLHDSAAGLIKISFPIFRIPDHLIKPVFSVFLVLLTVIICIYQIWYGDPDSKRYLQETFLGRKLNGQETQFSLNGTFNETSRDAATIINQHAQAGDKVQTGMDNFWPIQFFTGYQYQYIRGGTVRLSRKNFTLKDDFAKSMSSRKIKGRLLFLWPNGWVHRLKHWNQYGELRIRYVFESDLLRQFGGSKPVFVALDNRWAHIGEYLEKVPGTRKISQDPTVYQVKKFIPAKGFGLPRVARQIGRLLAQLRGAHPENYQIVRNTFFPNFFGFKPEQVDAMADLDGAAAGVVFIDRN